MSLFKPFRTREEKLMTSRDKKPGPARHAGDGAVGGVVTSAAEMLYSVTQGSFGAMGDLRDAVFGLTRGTLDWVDSSQRQTIGLARNLAGRADDFLKETADSLESWLLSIIDRGRETGHGAADLAARAAVSLTGTTEPREAA